MHTKSVPHMPSDLGETILCYTQSLKDKIWGNKETNNTEPKKMGLALKSLIGVIEGIVDSGSMQNWKGSEEQIHQIYQEIKIVMKENPEQITPEEVGDQWMEEYGGMHLVVDENLNK